MPGPQDFGKRRGHHRQGEFRVIKNQRRHEHVFRNRLTGSAVNGADDRARTVTDDMKIDFRRPNIAVPEQRLHELYVIACFDQTRGEGVPKSMRPSPALNAGPANRRPERFVKSRVMPMMTTKDAGLRVHADGGRPA